MFEELRYYLTSFKELINKLPLQKSVYIEGSTVGQIAFHCAQSINFWIRVVVLKGFFDRDRSKEFKEQTTLDEINKSLDLALEACDILCKKNINLEEKLEKPITIDSANLVIENNLQAIVHAISHVAEHYGELNQVGRG